MKEYPSIYGITNNLIGNNCFAFHKYDGSNIRYEWHKKHGWYKFGTRTRFLEETDPTFGIAIKLFMNKYSEELSKIIVDKYKGADSAIAFCEFFGPSSFAGYHNENEQKEVVLFDINIHKRGLISPIDFINMFGKLEIPKIVYNGILTNEFISDIRTGKYGDNEGVVVKGIFPNKKPPHGIWMAKIKTNWWLDRLKQKAIERPEFFASTLNDNQKEQGICLTD